VQFFHRTAPGVAIQIGVGRKLSVTDTSRKSAVGRIFAAALAIAQAAVIAGCASGSSPPLPTPAEYERSCADLVAEYRQLDAAARNRRTYAQVADATIGTAAIVLAFASGGTLGVGLPLGAIAVQRVKGDLGYSKKVTTRETIHALAVRKGCTADSEAAPPEAAGAAAQGSGTADPDRSVFRSLRRAPN
jgi:hypothetical protein